MHNLLFVAPQRLNIDQPDAEEPNNINNTIISCNKNLDSTYEVMEWPAMNKTWCRKYREIMREVSSCCILYVVVAFGVFGTILMMTMERKKEFAAMIAVGMRRFKAHHLLYAGNHLYWIDGNTNVEAY